MGARGPGLCARGNTQGSADNDTVGKTNIFFAGPGCVLGRRGRRVVRLVAGAHQGISGIGKGRRPAHGGSLNSGIGAGWPARKRLMAGIFFEGGGGSFSRARGEKCGKTRLSSILRSGRGGRGGGPRRAVTLARGTGDPPPPGGGFAGRDYRPALTAVDDGMLSGAVWTGVCEAGSPELFRDEISSKDWGQSPRPGGAHSPPSGPQGRKAWFGGGLFPGGRDFVGPGTRRPPAGAGWAPSAIDWRSRGQPGDWPQSPQISAPDARRVSARGGRPSRRKALPLRRPTPPEKPRFGRPEGGTTNKKKN